MLSNWCWRRLLRVLGTARRSNQSILKEINPECASEGLMLKLKLQYFGHLVGRAKFILFQIHWKRSQCWKRLKAGGHIKASLQTSCGNLIYSCTGDEIHIHEVPGQGSYLEFTAIVFFVEEKQLESHLEPLLKILC